SQDRHRLAAHQFLAAGREDADPARSQPRRGAGGAGIQARTTGANGRPRADGGRALAPRRHQRHKVTADVAHREGAAFLRSVPAAERGLDWLNLFVAGVQGGFGPFVAVYLTTQGWTQTTIGFALSIGTVTAMVSQVPSGALVDAMPRKSQVAAFSIVVFAVS